MKSILFALLLSVSCSFGQGIGFFYRLYFTSTTTNPSTIPLTNTSSLINSNGQWWSFHSADGVDWDYSFKLASVLDVKSELQIYTATNNPALLNSFSASLASYTVTNNASLLSASSAATESRLAVYTATNSAALLASASAAASASISSALAGYTATNNPNVVAQAITTQLASILRQTNWSVSPLITNAGTRPIQVSGTVTNSSVLVIGQVGMELRVGNSNSATMYVADVQAFSTLLVGGLITSQRAGLRATVPPGGYFQFANVTSGTGNGSTLASAAAQYLLLP